MAFVDASVGTQTAKATAKGNKPCSKHANNVMGNSVNFKNFLSKGISRGSEIFLDNIVL